ncbi:MAG TPA: porin [Pirellulales bacterium]|nr:porin [Pirellulales bacterium]
MNVHPSRAVLVVALVVSAGPFARAQTPAAAATSTPDATFDAASQTTTSRAGLPPAARQVAPILPPPVRQGAPEAVPPPRAPNIRSLLQEPELPENDEEGYRQRVRATELELEDLRRRLQRGQIGGGILFRGRDPDSFQPFAPRLSLPEERPVSYPNMSVTGFFQQDTGFFSQNQNSEKTFGPLENGADFRRARIALLGNAAENINYFMELDFALAGHPSFRDVWAEVTAIPWIGNVRAGYFKAPFSLEELQSARQLEFLERANPVNAFAPFRRLGVLMYNHLESGRATWAGSFTRGLTDPYGGDIGNSGGWAGTGRATWLPYYDEPSGGRYYLHLGAAYELNYPGTNTFRYRTTPEVFIGSQQSAGAIGNSGATLPGPLNGTPFFVDSGTLSTDHFSVYGTELAGSWGPFNFQSEWMATTVSQIHDPAAFMQGAFVQGSYFLTGEHRPYIRPSGTLGSVKPFENFFALRRGQGWGRGAWELAGRLSWVDLDSKNVQGGRLTDYTAGLNWYLHANVKLQINYIHAWLDNPVNGKSNTDIFATRLQAQF